VILPTALLDNTIDAWSQSLFGIPTGLLISGTVMVVVIGYVVRFLALSYGAMEAGLARITPNMDGAARTLGAGPGRLLLRVHLPLLRASLLTAGLLVFVDCMKELPMTMILRPFNFETLATFVHQYAMDERLEESAPGALAIVIVGILPVILLSRTLGARLKANVAPVVGSVEVAAR
jgi:iron(III) transport system permease protein